MANVKEKSSRKRAGSARNIERVLLLATPEELMIGREWYDRFRQDIRDRVRDAGLWLNGQTLDRAIAVAAALSPQRSPRANLSILARFLSDRANDTAPDRPYQVRTQAEKAFRVWLGARAEEVLTGPKERAFYGAISGDADSVTIDGHAFSIFVGRRITTDAARVPKQGPRRQAIEDAYRAVARKYGMRASQVQAITWIVWRRLHQSETTRKQVGADRNLYL